MAALTKIREINQNALALISNGKYAHAYKILDAVLKKYSLDKKHPLSTSKAIFELQRLKYEAAVYIMPAAKAHKVLHELYSWSILSRNETWGRLELIEFKVRFNPLTSQEAILVLKNIEKLIVDAQEQNNLEVAVWAGNKYFKLIPLCATKINYKKYLFLIKVAQEQKLTEAEMWFIYHLALIHVHNQEYAKAKSNFLKSLELAYSINQKEGIKWNLYNIGQVFLQGDHDRDKATQYFSQAISISNETEAKNNYDSAILESISEIQHHLIQFNRLAILGRRVVAEAHDLKNLLCANQLAINNLESIINQCQDNKEYQIFLTSIKQTNQEILNKAKNILAQARTTSPQDKSLGGIYISDALHNFKKMVVSMLKESYMTVDLVIAKSTLKLTSNISEKDLTQGLLNMTLNSIDALNGEKGKITIKLTTENKKPVLYFSDNGPGVPPEARKSLFRAFFTTKSSGTGIGLFTTKELLKQNNISIDLSETQKKGATFVLRFN